MLHDDRRARNALVQTPYWVADLILDETLIPAADEFRQEHLIRTIDPACGTIVPPDKAARRILASVDGVEIDPLTAAVARFRVTV